MSHIFSSKRSAAISSISALLIFFAFALSATIEVAAQDAPGDPAADAAGDAADASNSENAPDDSGYDSTTPYTELTPEELAERQKEAEQACAACGGSMLVLVLAAVAAIALNIFLLVWVARDAKSRGMDSSVLWMFLVMFTGLLGLIIYIFSRPQGELVQCASCNGKRLSASAKCPHCQNA